MNCDKKEDLRRPFDRVIEVPTPDLTRAPENQQIYGPMQANSERVNSLRKSIRENGILEPLVATEDLVTVSGNTRHFCSELEQLPTVPCRILKNVVYLDLSVSERLALLVEYNHDQRVKTFQERLREKLVTMEPEAAYQSLLQERQKASQVDVDKVCLGESKGRASISKAKRPMADAVVEVVESLRQFWPLSVRTVHYKILNNPPLRNTNKPDSRYANDLRSYKDLCDIATRLRLSGELPMSSVDDETRSTTEWDVWPDPEAFVSKEVDRFLKGFQRDLLVSQPNHVELLVEKNTLLQIIRPVAMEYCLPLTSGRGFASLPPRMKMAQRFRQSGKQSLIVVVVSDFDPEGEEIPKTFGQSMRDDFGIHDVTVVKSAIRKEHIERFSLMPEMQAKTTSSNREKFVAEHGTEDVFEVEALEPDQLQTVLKETLNSILDIDLFNRELEMERGDAVKLQALRNQVVEVLKEVDFDDLGQIEE